MKKVIAFYLIMLVAWICTGASRQAEGKNLVFTNPNPDRTWTKQVGGFLSSAKSYAVVISISEYVGKEKGGYPKLDTRNDAEKIKNFLLEDMGFDYVRVITDADVTRKNIDVVMLDEMRTLVGPNDRFLFYWSGHGDQLERMDDNKEKVVFGFLPLYDSKVGTFSSMISMDDIGRWNSYLPVRHALFILDACLSGLAGVNTKSDPRMDQLSLPARFLITAGMAREEAIAGDNWGGSLFTDTFVKVAREHAKSSVVSIYKVFDEIQKRVAVEKQKARWPKPLTPQLKDLQGGGGAFFFSTGGGPMIASQTSAVKEVTVAEKGTVASMNADSNQQSKSVKNSQSAMVSPPVLSHSRPLVSHCKQATKASSGLSPGDVSKLSALALDEAIRVHLGASAHLLSNYTRTVGTSSSSRETFNWTGLLRGSFSVIEAKVPKCDGKVTLTRSDVVDDDRIVAVVYKASYELVRSGRRKVCLRKGDFYDLKDAFDGVLFDMQVPKQKIAVSDLTKYSFQETKLRSVQLEESFLGFVSEMTDIPSEGKTGANFGAIEICEDYFVYAARGYQ